MLEKKKKKGKEEKEKTEKSGRQKRCWKKRDVERER